MKTEIKEGYYEGDKLVRENVVSPEAEAEAEKAIEEKAGSTEEKVQLYYQLLYQAKRNGL